MQPRPHNHAHHAHRNTSSVQPVCQCFDQRFAMVPRMPLALLLRAAASVALLRGVSVQGERRVDWVSRRTVASPGRQANRPLAAKAVPCARRRGSRRRRAEARGWRASERARGAGHGGVGRAGWWARPRPRVGAICCTECSYTATQECARAPRNDKCPPLRPLPTQPRALPVPRSLA